MTLQKKSDNFLQHSLNAKILEARLFTDFSLVVESQYLKILVAVWDRDLIALDNSIQTQKSRLVA
jgi:hypothetical protein